MSIQDAIQFVVDEVEDPALNHPMLEKEFKNKVTRSKVIVHRIKKVGDLKRYLQRFEKKPTSIGQNPLYDRFKELGLKTYEDLYPEFCTKFAPLLDDVTVLDDFVLGGTYTSWDISIFAQTYDTQAGIYVIGEQAIFIKATLENGKYPNKWVIPNEKLQYYFYSREGVFNESYVYNSSIINSKKTNVPIYVFINTNSVLRLNGIFEYESHHSDPSDGSKWFILNKRNSLHIKRLMTDREYQSETTKEIKKSRDTDQTQRRERLKTANKIPETLQVVSTAFKRNPDVIVEVLQRSKGCCEKCGLPAPFLRQTDLSPYLEVHHKVPLAEGGEDTVENAIALCPNCHRAEHHAADVKTSVAAVIIENGKLLVTRRRETSGEPVKWEFPRFNLEPSLTYEQCLRRGLHKNLSISVRVGNYLCESVTQLGGDIIRLMAYHTKRVKGEIQLDNLVELNWLTRDELANGDFSVIDNSLALLLQKRIKF